MSHRAYLTKQEVAKVDALAKAYTNQEVRHDFACSGIFPPHAVDTKKLGLYYQKPNGSDGIKHATIPLTGGTAKEIYDTGENSPFARGNELVYDDTYRQAHELKPPHFALSYDILSASGLLALLAKKLDYEIPLEGRINKLNAYTQGGFFKPHKDTPQNKNHIGTLMICLPSPFTGGDLVIRQSGYSVTFDWANQIKNGSFAWGFLYSDCEHEVIPGTSGTRITIAYDIFIGNNSTSFDGNLLDTRFEPIMKALRDILAPDFRAGGGALASGLAHEYPFASNEYFPGNLTSRLKGSDALLVAAIQKLGLKMSYLAINDRSEYSDDDSDSSMGDSEYEADRRNDDTFRKDMWVSGDIRAAQGAYTAGDPSDLGLEQDLNLIWVTVPVSYAIENSYVTYGNEPESETICCAIGIEVQLSAAANRVQDTARE